MQSETRNNCQTLLFIIACCLTVVGLLIALSASSSASGYSNLFSGFGAELPTITKFVLDYGMIGWVLPVLSLLYCVYVLARWQTVNMKPFIIFIAIAYVGSEIWRQVFAFAMNAPIMQMGKVVGGV